MVLVAALRPRVGGGSGRRSGSSQFSKPLPHILPAQLSARIAVFAPCTVDSQQGQQVTDPTSKVHYVHSNSRTALVYSALAQSNSVLR